ncbi:methyl-accepting chemotaxis protein [Alkalicoccus urumqiensis]|nr:HAMP domain-containing methyl-accepting chemotaxis protein [Alkalicoccus urumqiensis]
MKGRLIGSYLLLAVVVVGLGGLALWGMARMNDNTEAMYEDRVAALSYIVHISELLENTRLQMVSGVLEEDPSHAEAALENIASLNEYAAQYEATRLTTEEAAIFGRLQENWTSFSGVVTENTGTLAAGAFAETQAGLANGAEPYQAAREAAQELTVLNEEISAELYTENQQVFGVLRVLVFTFGALAAVGAVVMGWWMGRSMGQPILALNKRLKEVAAGDLRGEPLTSRRTDEIGDLVTSANAMQGQMQEIIAGVAGATEQVGSSSTQLSRSAGEVQQGTSQIAATMQELSSGAESQANHASSLADRMITFTEHVEEGAARSEEADKAAERALSLSETGRGQMTKAVEQMAQIDTVIKEAASNVGGLDQESRKVSSLVSVIEDIAEQTNLLALNAAIEAARAGEHGRGFSVVAEEVRRLAEQVSSSVSEITKIVEGIQRVSGSVVTSLEQGYEEVEAGSREMAQTEATFADISESVNDMAGQVRAVHDRLRQMAVDTEEMSSSVQEIASVSEESAAGVEQTTASAQQSAGTMQEVSSSSDELAQLADSLRTMVQRFRLQA